MFPHRGGTESAEHTTEEAEEARMPSGAIVRAEPHPGDQTEATRSELGT